MAEPQSTQPVYVLGAGFSKAISDEMPVTNELGDEIRRRLAGHVDLTDLQTQSFEEWLTLRVTAMPFLERHENARRLADAERVIAEVAQVVQERTDRTSADAVPLWLAQLLVLWTTEEALVVTFNYDTLLERAINDLRVPTSSRDGVRVPFSDDYVRPAPQAPRAEINVDL